MTPHSSLYNGPAVARFINSLYPWLDLIAACTPLNSAFRSLLYPPGSIKFPISERDVIFDAYGGGNHPWHLLTRESFDLAKQRLQPNGILVVNFLGFVSGEHEALVRSLEATLRSAFKQVEVYTSLQAGDYANVIFVAHEGRSRVLWPEGPYQRRGSFQDGRPAQIVTDSLNPIALWSAAVERRWREESQRMLEMAGGGE